MKNAVTLHGICDENEYFDMDFPSPSNAHWLPWLQQKFCRAGILCQCLEMPKPYKPVYEEWKQTFEQLNVQDLAFVVGHSAGCGFILKWLHQNPAIKFEKLILVAPWLDPTKRMGEFVQFELKPEGLKNVGEIHLFHSEDDMEAVKITQERLIAMYPKIIQHNYKNMGHFCLSDIGPTFEDLWDVLK